MSRRLTKLVEIVVRDAVEREDKSLTKQTIRDILGKVVGREMVAEEKDFIYAQVGTRNCLCVEYRVCVCV